MSEGRLGLGEGDQGEAWWLWFGSWAGLGSNPVATNDLLWVTLGVTLSEPPCLLYEEDRRELQGLWGPTEVGLDPTSPTSWVCS